MTKENRVKAYAHFLHDSENYVAPPHLNHGPTSTSKVRARASEILKMLLKRNPELADVNVDGKIDVSYSDRSKAELQKLCSAAGIEFNSKATKDDLVVLLENKADEVK